MKRLALWLLLGGLTLATRAQNPDAEFLQVYTLIQEGEALDRSGETAKAVDRFTQARRELEALAKSHPNWNPKIIKFRLQYLAEKLEGSNERPAAVTSPVVTAPRREGSSTTVGTVVPPSAMDDRLAAAEARADQARRAADEANARANIADERTARLALDLRTARDRVEVLEASHSNLEKARESLERERSTLESRLAEALKPKPADLDPAELAKARERILLLMKENEILEASLERQVAENRRILETAGKAVELEKQLDQAREELGAQRRQNEQLRGEREKLLAKVEHLSKPAANKDSEETRALRTEVETLRRELAAARSAEGTGSANELASLRRNLADQRAAAETLRSDNVKLLREIERLTAIRITPASLKVAELPPAEPTEDERARLRRLERERDDLRREIIEARAEIRRRDAAAASSAPNPGPAAPPSEKADTRVVALSREVERLGARVASLEAAPQPYTAEELALFQAPARRDSLAGDAVRPATRSGSPVPSPGPDLASWGASSRDADPFPPPPDLIPPGPYASAGGNGTGASPGTRSKSSGTTSSPIRLAQADPAPTPPTTPASASPSTPSPSPAPTNAPSASPEAERSGFTNAPAATGARRRTTRDLPPGASVLAAQAQRAFAQRRLEEAENRYREILLLDENNVFTLGNLAAILVERNRVEDGEAMLQRALKVDAQDPFSLSLLGIIRFRQQRYEEAFDALSRSAQIDPDNADTQNYLGITLSQRGQRKAAEAALRKALKINPGSASAHYNLAVVYATQKPPFLELARYHYEKSRRAGQPSNPAFEAVLKGGEAAPAPPRSE